DREIVVGIRIHQLRRNCIEPLRSLTVALMQFRPEIARPATDGIGFEELKMAGEVLFPNFELRFLLENADEDRRVFRHLFLLEERQQLARYFLGRLGWQLIGWELFAVFAKARERRQSAGESGRR